MRLLAEVGDGYYAALHRKWMERSKPFEVA